MVWRKRLSCGSKDADAPLQHNLPDCKCFVQQKKKLGASVAHDACGAGRRGGPGQEPGGGCIVVARSANKKNEGIKRRKLKKDEDVVCSTKSS